METKEWFLYVVDHHEGPYTAEEIKKLVAQDSAKPTSFVWKEGQADWMMYSDVPDFGAATADGDGHGSPSFSPQIIASSRKSKSTSVSPISISVPTTPEVAPSMAPVTSEVTGGHSAAHVGVDEKVWCLNGKKGFSGPLSMAEIAKLVKKKKLTKEASVWKEGWMYFAQISEVPEFMALIEPRAESVVEGVATPTEATPAKESEAKPVKKKGVSSAQALGLDGSAAVRQYKWYKSTKFFFVALSCLILGFYQAVATGKLDTVLEKFSLSQKVKQLGLPVLPFEAGLNAVGPLVQSAVPMVKQTLGRLPLPEPIRKFFVAVQLPEDVTEFDARRLQEAAGSELGQDPKVAVAVIPGDELSPSFVIATNAADGTKFQVQLTSKDGTILSTVPYEKTEMVEVQKHLARSPKFSLDGTNPLPKGEYFFRVLESGKTAPLVTWEAFLGGLRDATYSTRLAEFKERAQKQREESKRELNEITLTLESMANDSATRFFELTKIKVQAKKKVEWAKFHVRYEKFATQVKGALQKTLGSEAAKNLNPYHSLFASAEKTYELTDQLHRSQTNFIEKGGPLETIQIQAKNTLDSLNALKASIAKEVQ